MEAEEVEILQNWAELIVFLKNQIVDEDKFWKVRVSWDDNVNCFCFIVSSWKGRYGERSRQHEIYFSYFRNISWEETFEMKLSLETVSENSCVLCCSKSAMQHHMYLFCKLKHISCLSPFPSFLDNKISDAVSMSWVQLYNLWGFRENRAKEGKCPTPL